MSSRKVGSKKPQRGTFVKHDVPLKGTHVELQFKVDAMKPPDKKGKQKVLKRGIIRRWVFNTEHLSMPSQVINAKGNIDKRSCQVHIQELGFVIVNHSYEYIKSLIHRKEPERNPIGFKYKNKDK